MKIASIKLNSTRTKASAPYHGPFMMSLFPWFLITKLKFQAADTDGRLLFREVVVFKVGCHTYAKKISENILFITWFKEENPFVCGGLISKSPVLRYLN